MNNSRLNAQYNPWPLLSTRKQDKLIQMKLEYLINRQDIQKNIEMYVLLVFGLFIHSTQSFSSTY